MLNPGSVGQPRDRDRRAGYMIYDTDSQQVTLHRLEYPIEQAQERIRAAGLPDMLADRLGVGSLTAWVRTVLWRYARTRGGAKAVGCGL